MRKILFFLFFIISVAAEGQVTFQNYYSFFGDTGYFNPLDIQQTTDGGYIITGQAGATSITSSLALLKTDSIGTQLWSRSFGTWDSLQGIANDEELISVKKTPANGFILAGSVLYINKIYLIELDSIGNVLWSRFYGTNASQLRSLNALSDGYIFTFGSYLVKIDLQGNILWYNAFYPYPLNAIRTNDGNYLWSKYNGIAKSDSLGNIIWS